MANKKKPAAPQITNRRARYDYALGDELMCGLVLTGPEVRAARDGHVQLKGSFVTLRGGSLWLNNASFSLKGGEDKNARTVDTTARRLLAHKKQIDAFEASRQQGMSIVPLRLLTQGRFIKLVIALGKGKKNYDKRETLKRRDQEREAHRLARP